MHDAAPARAALSLFPRCKDLRDSNGIGSPSILDARRRAESLRFALLLSGLLSGASWGAIAASSQTRAQPAAIA